MDNKKTTSNYPPISPPNYQNYHNPPNNPQPNNNARYDTVSSYSQIQNPSNPLQQPPITYPQQNVIFSTLPGADPLLLTCPRCLKLVMTVPKPVNGLITWLACFGCTFIGCCCVPFCTKSLKDVKHKCPACHHVIARYERI